MNKEILTFAEIDNLAKYLGKLLKNGHYITVGLIGNLGTGKTYFTKSLCNELNILENIKSPTFNYVYTYKSKDFKVSHFDVYRINDVDEMFEIGYEDYLDGETRLIIEWADKILDILPKDTIFIEFEYYSENQRIISTYTLNKGVKNYVDIFSYNKH